MGAPGGRDEGKEPAGSPELEGRGKARQEEPGDALRRREAPEREPGATGSDVSHAPDAPGGFEHP